MSVKGLTSNSDLLKVPQELQLAYTSALHRLLRLWGNIPGYFQGLIRYRDLSAKITWSAYIPIVRFSSSTILEFTVSQELGGLVQPVQNIYTNRSQHTEGGGCGCHNRHKKK